MDPNDPSVSFGKTQCFKILLGMIESIPQDNKSSIDKINSYAKTLIDRILKNIENEKVLNVIDTNYEVIYNLIQKVVD